MVQRNTRLCLLAALPDASASSVRAALTTAMQYLPATLRQTLTYDRGREMAGHRQLEEDLQIQVYFCDPHSPWRRGTCENMNGLIRQYLPKGIDLNQARLLKQNYLPWYTTNVNQEMVRAGLA